MSLETAIVNALLFARSGFNDFLGRCRSSDGAAPRSPPPEQASGRRSAHVVPDERFRHPEVVGADERFGDQGSSAPAIPRERYATHPVVWPRAADGCLARMMRKPNRPSRRRTPRCCFCRALGLLVCHASSNGVGRLLRLDPIVEVSDDCFVQEEQSDLAAPRVAKA